jgi:RHS repeat-associated protein
VRTVLLGVLTLVALGLDVARDRAPGGSAWRLALAPAAEALSCGAQSAGEPGNNQAECAENAGGRPAITTQSCEMPPQDEPDGDGDECNSNYDSQITPTKNEGGKDPDCLLCSLIGDPINYMTGSFYQEERDYASAGPFPLMLGRYYNSQDSGVQGFGQFWRGAYSRAMVRQSATVIIAQRDDGRAFTFTLTNGAWTAEPDVNARLRKVVAGWSYTSATDETEIYDDNGKLISIANRAGLKQTFAYDAQGRLASATDPFGRALTFSYISATSSQIGRVTAPDGGVYAYGYDTSHRLVSVTFPGGAKRQYVYGNTKYLNALTAVTDEDGAPYARITYDTNGRATTSQHAGGADLYTVDYTYMSLGVITVTNPLGGNTLYELQGLNGSAKAQQAVRSCSNCRSTVGGTAQTAYDANGNTIAASDFNGYVTSYAYDTSRNVETSRTLPSGETITTTWHPTFRLPLQISEPDRTTTFTYDAHGNELSRTIASTSITSKWAFTYNSGGQVLTATDPDGNVTRNAYDGSGNLISVTNALGQVTKLTSYDANGRPLTIEDPNGVVTTLAYNFRGQVTSRRTLQWDTAYAYDPAGLLTKLTNPDKSFLAFTYDGAHRLVGVADAMGDTIAYVLDAAGNRTTERVFDAAKSLSRLHGRAFDGFSRLIQDIGAQNQTTSVYYDGNDNISAVYDPNNLATYFYYDGLNRLTRTYDAEGGSTSFGYDAESRLTSVADPRGLTTAYAVNGLDEQQAITSPDTGATNRTFDAAGNVLTSTDARGDTTTYAYDGLNRMIRQSTAGGQAITYAYDQGAGQIGHLTSMADSAEKTDWRYNAHGQLISKQVVAGGNTLMTQLTYTPATGRLLTMTYPSGSLLQYRYDADGRINGISRQPPGGGSASALISNVTYDPFGPATGWTDGNGAAYARAYDQNGRVRQISLPASDQINLTYDNGGRVTTLAETGLGADHFTYDNVNRVTGYANGSLSQSYRYDYDGNRVSFSATGANPVSLSYTYDNASNHLLSVAGSSSETYTYDADGNTLRHVTPSATYGFTYGARDRLSRVAVGSTAETYAIDGLGQRVTKTPAGGAPTAFVYDEAGHIAGRYDTTVGYEETVYLGDLPVALMEPAGPYFIAPDNLGSPHHITDINGQVVWQWDHDPFGVGQPTGLLASYEGRFPGQFADTESGRNYNYYRDYDPSTGRYIESDPVGLAAGVNSYDYVAANPLGMTDRMALDNSSDEAANTAADGTGLLISIWNPISDGQFRSLLNAQYYKFGLNGNQYLAASTVQALKNSAQLLDKFGLGLGIYGTARDYDNFVNCPSLSNFISLASSSTALAATAFESTAVAVGAASFGFGFTIGEKYIGPHVTPLILKYYYGFGSN